MPRAVRRGRKFRGRPAAHDGLSVIIAYGNRCMSLTPEAYARHRVGKSVIVCHDGYRLSVIAGPSTNCSPRPSMIDRRPRVYDLAAEQAPTYHGPYHEVEVLLYGEEPHWWSRVTVLAGLGVPVRVPVSAVGFLIREHGGVRRDAPSPRSTHREAAPCRGMSPLQQRPSILCQKHRYRAGRQTGTGQPRARWLIVAASWVVIPVPPRAVNRPSQPALAAAANIDWDASSDRLVGSTGRTGRDPG